MILLLSTILFQHAEWDPAARRRTSAISRYTSGSTLHSSNRYPTSSLWMRCVQLHERSCWEWKKSKIWKISCARWPRCSTHLCTLLELDGFNQSSLLHALRMTIRRATTGSGNVVPETTKRASRLTESPKTQRFQFTRENFITDWNTGRHFHCKIPTI